MPRDRRGSRVAALAGAASLTLGACGWARPVTYAVPPGLSASFAPSQQQASTQYAQTFCSVLAEPAFAGDSWAACDRYVRMPAALPPSALAAIPTDWTLLLVGGLGAECFAPEVTVFRDAADHLASQHSLTSHRIPVAAFGNSSDNAKAIRDYIATLSEPKFIAITHSKGAVDFMIALADFPAAMSRVEALITVAGAVGGSWLADDLALLNELAGRALSRSCVPGPAIAAETGIDSMKRRQRQEYLAQTEHGWRAYSISAVSHEGNISRALKPLWKRLLPYARENDSHIVEREAIVPGGTFLGRALGDHLAVAFPISTSAVPQRLRDLFNHNRFPRPALIETAVRFVIADLQANP